MNSEIYMGFINIQLMNNHLNSYDKYRYPLIATDEFYKYFEALELITTFDQKKLSRKNQY